MELLRAFQPCLGDQLVNVVSRALALVFQVFVAAHCTDLLQLWLPHQVERALLVQIRFGLLRLDDNEGARLVPGRR